MKLKVKYFAKKMFKEPCFLAFLMLFGTTANIIFTMYFPRNFFHPKQDAVLHEITLFNYDSAFPNAILIIITCIFHGFYTSIVYYYLGDKFYFKQIIKIFATIGCTFFLLMTFNKSEFNTIATILATFALLKDKIDK